MNSTGLIFAVALVASLVLTRVARALAVRLNAIDWPDGWRKLHARPIPLWGGVAIYFSMVLALIVARQLPMKYNADLLRFSTALIISAGLVFALGLVDDCRDLRGRLKLILQIAAVVPLMVDGYWFDEVVLFGQTYYIGYAGLLLSMLWLVGCINAVNLLDGMDGNASTVGLLSATAMAAIAFHHDLFHVVLTAAALAGAILGFMVYNLPPATIYLGDSGSTAIGLVLGLLCLEGGFDSHGADALGAIRHHGHTAFRHDAGDCSPQAYGAPV